MDEKNKLTLYMGIFYLLVILGLGLILINEKGKDFKIPIAEKKIKNYIKENYKDTIEEFKYGKTKRRKDTYIMTIYNNKNKDLYFKVTYKNKKYKSTYKKDYYEGNTLNKNIEKYLNNQIEKRKPKKSIYDIYKVVYNTKLNNTTKYVKNKLLDKDYNIPIYTIYVEKNYNDNITTTFNNLESYTKKLDLNPKDYHIILNNEKNLNKSIDLKINVEDIKTKGPIIEQAIKNNNLKSLQNDSIEIKYLN